MKITIVAPGQRMPDWINQGVIEYSKRFGATIDLQVKEISAGKRSKSSSVEKSLKQEAARISAAIPKGSHVIVLDEHGKSQTTLALAKNMRSWMQHGKNIAFIIGGADGVHEQLKNQADERWSLSEFTLPHGLARVILIEQLYRAWTVINKHPYHRE